MDSDFLSYFKQNIIILYSIADWIDSNLQTYHWITVIQIVIVIIIIIIIINFVGWQLQILQQCAHLFIAW